MGLYYRVAFTNKWKKTDLNGERLPELVRFRHQFCCSLLQCAQMHTALFTLQTYAVTIAHPLFNDIIIIMQIDNRASVCCTHVKCVFVYHQHARVLGQKFAGVSWRETSETRDELQCQFVQISKTYRSTVEKIFHAVIHYIGNTSFGQSIEHLQMDYIHYYQ